MRSLPPILANEILGSATKGINLPPVTKYTGLDSCRARDTREYSSRDENRREMLDATKKKSERMIKKISYS